MNLSRILIGGITSDGIAVNRVHLQITVVVLRALLILILGMANVPPILVEQYGKSRRRYCQNEPEPKPRRMSHP